MGSPISPPFLLGTKPGTRQLSRSGVF